LSETLGLPKLRFARSAAVCALVLSIIALCWAAAGVTEPMQLPFLYPMRRAAAIGVGSLAIGVIGLLTGRAQMSRIAGLCAIATGILALSGLIIHWSQIDMSPSGPLPAIIDLLLAAFPNALCFIIAGAAVTLLAEPRISVHKSVFASISGAVTAMLGLCSLVNELLRLLPANPAFEGEVTVDATVALMLLGAVLVRIAYTQAARAGEEIQVFRPIIVVVLGTIAAFIMWRSLLEERSRVVAYQTANTANGIARALRYELNRRMLELRHVADAPTAPALFEESDPERTSRIRWTDLRMLISRSEPDDAALKRLLADRGERIILSYALLVELNLEPRVVFAAPLKRGDLRIMVTPLQDVVVPLAANVLGPNFQLFMLREGEEVYRYPDPAGAHETSGWHEVEMPELDVVLRVYPRSVFVRRGASWASHMVLAIGLNASFLLAFSAYLLHVAKSRLVEVQDIRSGLEKEVEQRRLAQAELARKAKQLEVSNSDLREFAHVTSHDLQEPLRSINGFAQLLARRYLGKMDEDADEFLNYITEASTRMSGMIQGLLAYSRLVNAADLDEEVELGDAVEWAKSNLLLALEESNGCVEMGSLPVVRGNRVQLCQLMQNLIGNAIKYRGTDPPVIAVTAEMTGSEYVITVADNGIGLQSDFGDRIFGLFKRAHGRDFPGAGVGLALCKKIVERHGGRIWVESEVGVGSKFRFTLQSM
jgi:signal transduction histidine kinase